MADKGFKRKLTTIFCADVVGYSRLMEDNEEETIQTLNICRDSMSTLIEQHRGRVVDVTGDNLMAEFSSVVDAVRCAVKTQKEMSKRNAELPENRRMLFRIGVNLGDIVQEDDRIYGDGVNIAARLESMAAKGGICISGPAYDQVENKSDLDFEYLGEQAVKNIKKPVRVYQVKMEGEFFGVETSKELKLPDIPSIAVLPFTNMSIDPEQEYFCDGITEEIITGLATVPQLFVIARNSSFTYKGKHVKVQQVSEELGVKYILEGSVRKSSNKVRITTQLINAKTGDHLWAERYDRDLSDIFALQDEITMKIVTALQVKLTVGEQARLWGRRTDSLDAFLKYLAARSYYGHGKKDTYALVRQIAQEAIDFDEGYSDPYVLMAWTHWYDARQGSSESREESFNKAKLLTQRAQEIDDSHPDVHILLGLFHLYQMQHEKAISEGQKAITLGPNNAEAHMIMAHIFRFSGMFNKAVSMIQRALRLEPYYPSFYLSELAMCYYYLDRYEESVAKAKGFLSLAENRGEDVVLYYGHCILAMNYIRLGQVKKARKEGAEVLKQFPGYSLEWDSKASFYKCTEHLERQHEDLRKAGIK
jgi:adenylate cyclase